MSFAHTVKLFIAPDSRVSHVVEQHVEFQLLLARFLFYLYSLATLPQNVYTQQLKLCQIENSRQIVWFVWRKTLWLNHPFPECTDLRHLTVYSLQYLLLLALVWVPAWAYCQALSCTTIVTKFNYGFVVCSLYLNEMISKSKHFLHYSNFFITSIVVKFSFSITLFALSVYLPFPHQKKSKIGRL